VVGDILQPTHLLFILVVALLVLGPKRLPEVGKSLGKGLRDFRQAISGADDDDDKPSDFMGNLLGETTPAPAATAQATPPVAAQTAVAPAPEAPVAAAPVAVAEPATAVAAPPAGDSAESAS
jgi:sec-independent protein translocase protein TatA